MKRFLRIITIFLLTSCYIHGGGFNDLGNSARVASMGGAHIAVGNSPYSLFYNPAGIYMIKDLYVATSYANLFPGIVDDNLNYFALSGVVPLQMIGELGVGGTFLNSELWKEYTINFTYAREIYNNFALGGTFKLLGWSAEAAPGESPLSYTGFTADIGAFYTFKSITNSSDLSLGVVAKNITQPSISSSGSNDAKLPMQLGFGFAYISSLYDYIITADVCKEDDQISVKSGAEFSVFSRELLSLSTNLLLRLGYERIVVSDFAEQSGLNGGFGLNVENLIIDYGYQLPTELTNAGGMHKISLSYKF
ncbi:MAG: type IX secretion system membrane protein PorP/SprF [Ignavibacteriales bacterium]|nr:type IX secretion system membrane protein PorP/SprF [Ignavibacteriaceae bacterium]NLH61134.1 type IX secretion system membrane protein PorP/SprF [Ignavibacteriales bacterium]HOJ18962.1 type IX secretion system membrane protein PorP/SprF [Ignavibacteriaceae bacterium]HPO56460.1 type IX secretion system membrane protein PorP/SprF [Ignavibacteriaceae bacterium]